MSGYQHFPLPRANGKPAIRLLVLLNGAEDAPIRCRLVHDFLHDSSIFEALSYCWGDPTVKKSIEVDDANFEVTENLHSALLHLRSEHRSRLLWVDAVCINQLDVDEKTEQVGMMREIYERARTVNIWLGPAAQNSTAALNLVHQLNIAENLDKLAGIESRNFWDLDQHHYGLPLTTARVWYDLFDVLRRPWFSRAWIIQEMAVSSNAIVVCGHELVHWTDLVRAINYMAASGLTQTFGPEALQRLSMMAYTRRRFMDNFNQLPMQILMRHRRALASDPRDKLFAFCGLFHQPGLDEIVFKPDYRMETTEVYKDFAVRLLSRDKNLDILSVPHVEFGTRFPNLPTWVPDWSTSDLCNSLLSHYDEPNGPITTSGNYAATGSSQYIPIFDNEHNSLRLEGAIMDRILLVSTVYEASADHVSLDLNNSAPSIIKDQRILRDWENVSLCRLLWQAYPTGEKIRDVYRQTLLGGRTYDNAEAMKIMFDRWDYQLMKYRVLQLLRLDKIWFFKLLQWLMTCVCMIAQYMNWPSVIKFVLPNPETAFISLAVAVQDRRMMRSEMGYIGVVQKGTRNGDYVALCKGGKVPLIIRQRNDGPEWELVGDAYIHGMMQGEEWVEEDCEGMWFV